MYMYYTYELPTNQNKWVNAMLCCAEKVSVKKNHHFLKLCQEGQLGPPLVMQMFETKNDHFLKLCQGGV